MFNRFERNEDIKKEKGKIPAWVIAERLGIHEKTLYAWLRFDLSPERKSSILSAIKEVKEENGIK